MATAAIYARYSTDDQRETSLEDQIRRCGETARRAGFDVDEELIFSDAAISGSAKALDKRKGYAALHAAWDKGQFSALVVDELSRIARDALELAQVQRLIEDSGVRLITADGIDSSNATWGLHYGVISAMSAHALREGKHRVRRGMQGQLERGYMIAAAPFGYRMHRVTGDSGEPVGTEWIIEPSEAAVIKDAYEARKNGESFYAIANRLNAGGLAPPRRGKNGKRGFWRPATLRRILSNPIYRGVFIWNGSKKYPSNRNGEAVVETKDYPRPHLRIIDDETWHLCAANSSWIPRGGVQHLLAGLITCGVCHTKVTISKCSGSGTLHCVTCEIARRVGGADQFMGYAGAAGVKAALGFMIDEIFSKEVRREYRSRLRARLEEGDASILERAKAERAHADRVCKRLARMLRDGDGRSDEHIESEYAAARAEFLRTDERLRGIRDGLARIDQDTIKKHLAVDPTRMVRRLLAGNPVDPGFRASLARIFPKIRFVARPVRFVAEYEIELAAGVAFALATETGVLDEASVTVRLRVTRTRSQPARYEVERIG